MYLLDTDVLSELRKPARVGNAAVRKWVSEQDAGDFFLSVVSVLEVATGIARLKRRDSAQAERLRSWLEDDVLDEFSERLLPIGLEVAQRTALLHVPDPRPAQDALIAGTALVHDLAVVTRNVSHFEPMGVRVINPFEE
jgi:predicted nucleic acid-binding protein